MEMQRHAMLMYTSCGWFFDELSGIETTQVIQYAARTLQLYEEVFGQTIEPQLLERLEQAKSNIPENKNGRIVYEKFVRPAMVDRKKVAVHYGLMALFEPYPDEARVYCFNVQLEDSQRVEAGKSKLVIGKIGVASEITYESDLLSFGALYIGDHLMNCGVADFAEDNYTALKREIVDPFNRADFPEVIRILDRYCGESTYSLRSIFHDDQRKIVNTILKATLAEAEASHRQIYETHAPMMRFVTDLNIPLHGAFSTAAQFALNSALREAFQNLEKVDFSRITTLLDEARNQGVTLDGTTLGFALRRSIKYLTEQLVTNDSDLELIKKLEAAAGLARDMPFEVSIWRAQNNYYQILQKTYPERLEQARRGDATAREWVEHFAALGRNLSVKVDMPEPAQLRQAS
jgi:hypothetical protein